MDFSLLFKMQKDLDSHIETKHGLEEASLFDRKLLALYVELGELANETRCFKFWSEKGPSPFSIILEEYVDGIHFLLSIGIECGYDVESVYPFPESDLVDPNTLVSLFYDVIGAIHELRTNKDMEAYKKLFGKYLLLGATLQFTEKDILNAYFEKNKVNYERQKEGY